VARAYPTCLVPKLHGALFDPMFTRYDALLDRDPTLTSGASGASGASAWCSPSHIACATSPHTYQPLGGL